MNCYQHLAATQGCRNIQLHIPIGQASLTLSRSSWLKLHPVLKKRDRTEDRDLKFNTQLAIHSWNSHLPFCSRQQEKQRRREGFHTLCTAPALQDTEFLRRERRKCQWHGDISFLTEVSLVRCSPGVTHSLILGTALSTEPWADRNPRGGAPRAAGPAADSHPKASPCWLRVTPWVRASTDAMTRGEGRAGSGMNER